MKQGPKLTLPDITFTLQLSSFSDQTNVNYAAAVVSDTLMIHQNQTKTGWLLLGLQLVSIIHKNQTKTTLLLLAPPCL